MIEFHCKNCGKKLSVQDQHSDKRVKCPKCGSVGIVPDNSDKLKFNCENCGQNIRVPQIYAGKKGKCPKCKKIIIVPAVAAIPAESKGAGGSTSSKCNKAAQDFSTLKEFEKSTPKHPKVWWLPDIKGEVATNESDVSGMQAGAVVMKPKLSFRKELVGTIVLAAFTLVWIAGAWPFVIKPILDWQIGKAGLSLSIALYMISYVLTLVIIIGSLFECLMLLFNPRPMLTLSSGSVPLGGVIHLRWEFTGRISMIRQLTIVLYGREYASYEVTETVRHNDHTVTEKTRRTKANTFFEMEVFSTQDRREIGLGEVGLVIPTDSMHSFEANWNEIVWSIGFHGNIKWWPDVEEGFKIAVLPAGMEKV